MYWRGQKRVFIIRNKKQHLWAAALGRQPWPWVFPCLHGNKLHTTKNCCGFLSENSMIKPFLLKCGQLFESLYTACSCFGLTKSGLAVWGFSKENIQCASVERLLLQLLPQFSFSFRSMAQHRPTLLCLGQSTQTQQLCSKELGQVLVAEGEFCFLQLLHQLCSTCRSFCTPADFLVK